MGPQGRQPPRRAAPKQRLLPLLPARAGCGRWPLVALPPTARAASGKHARQCEYAWAVRLLRCLFAGSFDVWLPYN